MTPPTGTEPGPRILLVEDSDDDAEATLRALRQAGIDTSVVDRCNEGLEAWTHMTGPYRDPGPENLPGLILLDLNMPGRDGPWLLRRMQECGLSTRIPVAVISTANDPASIAECKTLGARYFVSKTLNWDVFRDSVGDVARVWMTRPPQEDTAHD